MTTYSTLAILRLSRGWLLLFLFSVSSFALAEEEKQIIRGTIEDFVFTALEQNQELEVERFSPQIQQEAVDEAMGIFDPLLLAEGNYEERERNLDQRTLNSVLSNPLFGGGQGNTSIYEERNETYRMGVEGLLPYGTQYQLSFLNRKISNDSNDFDSEFSS